MHDIRALFAGLGDLGVELTMLGRYLLTVLDEETQLLQIAARTPPEQSARLDSAYAALISGLNAEVTEWIQGWAPHIDKPETEAIAAVAVNALLGKRATNAFFHTAATDISDERYLTQWTEMLAKRLQSLPGP